MATRRAADRDDTHCAGSDLAEAQGVHGDPQELDHVHEREREGQAPVTAVDAEGDGLVAFRIERHELGRGARRGEVVERTVQQHDALLEEPAGQQLRQ